jgi:hypothetical protein
VNFVKSDRRKSLQQLEVRLAKSTQRLAIGIASAIAIYLLLLIYTNYHPAGLVESRKACTNSNQSRPLSLSERELLTFKTKAIQAVNSPEVWRHFPERKHDQ